MTAIMLLPLETSMPTQFIHIPPIQRICNRNPSFLAADSIYWVTRTLRHPVAQPAQIERCNKRMADSLFFGHGSPRGDRSASCSSHCSLGTRWKESLLGHPPLQSVTSDVSSDIPQTSGQASEMPETTSVPEESENAESDGNNILIAYFTAAENSGVDAIASASYTVVGSQAVGANSRCCRYDPEECGRRFVFYSDICCISGRWCRIDRLCRSGARGKMPVQS